MVHNFLNSIHERFLLHLSIDSNIALIISVLVVFFNYYFYTKLKVKVK